MRVLRRFAGATLAFSIGAITAFTAFQLWWLAGLVDELDAPTPARRFFARPVVLTPGQALRPAALEDLLGAAGFRPDASGPGSFRRVDATFQVHTRAADRPAAEMLRLDLSGDRLAVVTDLWLAPSLIGEDTTGSTARDWQPIEQLPADLVRLVQAVEDRRFAGHVGFDWRGLIRATWTNLRAGRLQEGASTVTQQLVRGRYLTTERSLWRKYNELLLAIMLERRFSKAEILEAYLNDAYLGQEGARELRGFPRAARHYFGRPLAELELEQLALLVGMLRGPSWYQPWRNPERARARRDRVLRAYYQTGWLARSKLASLIARPLGILPAAGNPGRQRFPAFLNLVRRQLGRGAQAPDRVPTALDLRVQLAAESALARALAGRSGLQGAVIVADLRSGEIVAAVGGTPVDFPGFNRVVDARRQVGSVIKPIYYWAALEDGGFHLLSPLEDTAISVPTDEGPPWRPENFDGRDEGRVPLVTALARSRNRASVRLGLTLGLERTREALARLGWQQPAPTHPAILLGAIEMSPIEVAQLYLSLARGGRATPLTAIARRPLPSAPEPVASHLLAAALVRAVEHGTGRGFAPRAVGELAGKTGTSNDGRDAWFAGWTRTHVLVVWIGRDDGRPAALSGAADAGPVVAGLAPTLLAGPVVGAPPVGARLRPVDLDGAVAIDEPCPAADHLPFSDNRRPLKSIPCPF